MKASTFGKNKKAMEICNRGDPEVHPFLGHFESFNCKGISRKTYQFGNIFGGVLYP